MPKTFSFADDAAWALVVCNALDVVSTWAGFSVGLTEANPMLPQSMASIALIKSGTTLGTLWLLHHVAGWSHPRLARWLGYLFAGVGGAAAAHNFTLYWSYTH